MVSWAWYGVMNAMPPIRAIRPCTSFDKLGFSPTSVLPGFTLALWVSSSDSRSHCGSALLAHIERFVMTNPLIDAKDQDPDELGTLCPLNMPASKSQS
jgi:hypothetical protein